MAFTVKGNSVFFRMDDERRIYLPKRLVMAHDPSGRLWPRNSVLFTAVRKDGIPVSMDADQREYFGRGYQAHQGTILDIPPRGLDRWQLLGHAKTIFYDRGGVRAPGFFKHTFRAPSLLTGGVIGGIVGGLVGWALQEATERAFILPGIIGGAALGVAVTHDQFPIDPPAKLYDYRGRFRLELPRLSHLSWRGFVLP